MSNNYEEQPPKDSAQWWIQRDELPTPPPVSGAPSAIHRSRPGSPVMPMGSWSKMSGSGGNNEPPLQPPTGQSPSKGPRRLMAGLVAFLMLASAAAGAGISHLVSGPSSTVNAASNGGTSAGNSGSLGTNSGGFPFSSGNSGTGSSNGELPFGNSGPDTGTSVGAGAPSDVSAIAAKVDPALVDINSNFNYQSASGAGTGIVLTSTGEILTNNHVIDGATKISVTDIGNGKTYNAKVVGYDATVDIAVLQLADASGLKTANIGDSSTAKVGEPVVAIGNAGGVGGTPSSAGGAIVALNKSIVAADDLDGSDEQLAGLIGVNADVQAGDSGGSLVNSSGQVLGIDVAGSGSSDSPFESSAETTSPQGFAIPINEAITIEKDIESGKGSTTIHVGSTAFLGVLISTSPSEGSNNFDNPFSGESGDSGNSGSTASGVVVSSVVSGAAAAEAGLTEGDVITSLDGKTVTSATALSKDLVVYHPGDRVQLGWTNTDGQSETTTVVLSSGPPA